MIKKYTDFSAKSDRLLRLAYFADEKNVEIFRPIVLSTKDLFVPTIYIYEVF